MKELKEKYKKSVATWEAFLKFAKEKNEPTGEIEEKLKEARQILDLIKFVEWISLDGCEACDWDVINEEYKVEVKARELLKQ